PVGRAGTGIGAGAEHQGDFGLVQQIHAIVNACPGRADQPGIDGEREQQQQTDNGQGALGKAPRLQPTGTCEHALMIATGKCRRPLAAEMPTESPHSATASPSPSRVMAYMRSSNSSRVIWMDWV